MCIIQKLVGKQLLQPSAVLKFFKEVTYTCEFHAILYNSMFNIQHGCFSGPTEFQAINLLTGTCMYISSYISSSKYCPTAVWERMNFPSGWV